MATTANLHLIIFFLIAMFTSQVVSQCEPEQSESHCIDKSVALPLKLIAIAAILITSMIGVCLPLLSRSIPSLQPDRDIFTIVKAFASGIILATGFMHVLPDSFDMLRSKCLSENPWHKFPFTGFVAMLSAIFTLMVDSIATSVYSKQNKSSEGGRVGNRIVAKDSSGELKDSEMGEIVSDNGSTMGVIVIDNGSTTTLHGHGHGHPHFHGSVEQTGHHQLLRYRVIAMVLEFGIVVHSIVIGISLGASNNTCTIKPLVAALCFHQMFEGMGLGGSILQADFKFVKKSVMVFFFSATTPLGILVGIALSNVYKENSPTSLIIEGLLNASSAGLLIYMALVDLLASDFMGPKLQGSIKLQVKSYAAVLLGAGGMSLLAKWA